MKYMKHFLHKCSSDQRVTTIRFTFLAMS